MKVIGLTGGIASGKSSVSKIFMNRGIPIIDADLIAREVVSIGRPALTEIIDCFGKKVINEDGSLNRKVLGRIVFGDNKELKKLNDITRRRIIDEIKNRIEMYRNTKDTSVIIVDAALLVEMEMTNLVDEVWLVTAKDDIQLERLIKRDGLSVEEATQRIESQMSTQKKEKYADIVIDNNGDISNLETQIDRNLKM